MKKLYPLLSVLLLISWGCEEQDTIPPTVTITFPQNNSSVSEMVTINCISSDNEGVEKVELWINGVSTELTDNSEPYSFDWNTTTLEDGNYTIIIRSYDTNENITDSDPIVLTVDNTQSNPTSVELYPITYSDGFQISWSQNNDDDFQSYKLFESPSEDMSNQILIYETGNISDTTFIKSFHNFIYHRLVIEDIWGFQSTSNIEVGDYEVELWGNLYSVLNTTELQLRNSGLTGSIPPEIGNLTNLTYLDLYKNELTDSIPSEIANLTNLTHLYLGDNQFTGQIPESICDLNIDWNNNFNIFSNQLCPPYPSCIEDYVGNQDISNCVVELWGEYYSIEDTDSLDLSGSWDNPGELTGSIPPEIGNLTNLTYLGLFNNELTGSIPSEIGNLTILTYLDLGENQLTGEIPPEIGNLTNLTILSLGGNELTETIPPEIGNLTNLEVLSIWGNNLTGELPSEIGNSANLSHLYLSFNELAGEIPIEIWSLINLSNLGLSNNQFTGELPSEIGNLTNMGNLQLQNNQLTGSIPPEIGNLTNLVHLGISSNQLTGEIPSEIGNLTNLERFYLKYNQLTGEIPIEIGNLTNMTNLIFDGNQLIGEIPSGIGNLTNLTQLSLAGNQLTGEIPLEIWSLTNLNTLWLEINQLTGEIPPEIGNLTNLTKLRLGDNQFTGEIPESICDLTNLIWVSNYDSLEYSNSTIYMNQLCPPHPSCIEDYVGEQDTSDCD